MDKYSYEESANLAKGVELEKLLDRFMQALRNQYPAGPVTLIS